MNPQNQQSNASVVANKTTEQVIREMINAGNYSSLDEAMKDNEYIVPSLCGWKPLGGGIYVPDLMIQPHLILGENPNSWVLPRPMWYNEIVEYITSNLPSYRFGTFGDLLSLGASKQKIGVDSKVVAFGSIFHSYNGVRLVGCIDAGPSHRRLELVRLRKEAFDKGVHIMIVDKKEFPVTSASWGIEG